MNDSKGIIAEFLNKVLNMSDMDVRDIQRLLNYYGIDDLELLILTSGTVFIELGEPLDFVYVLLQGNTSIVNQTTEGIIYHPNTLENPQMMGLLEASSGLDRFISGVVTTTDCVLIKVDRYLFEEIVLHDLSLTKQMYHFLGRLAMYQIDKRELMTVTDPFEILLLYIHGRVKNRMLPYKIRDRKDFLADYLHISESKLTNYLDLARKRGFLRLFDDALLIDTSNFERLQSYVASMMIS